MSKRLRVQGIGFRGLGGRGFRGLGYRVAQGFRMWLGVWTL